MYKKLVLASTIAMIHSQAGAAITYATDLGTLAVKHTKEGISKSVVADGVATSNTIAVLNASYSAGDIATITYSVPKAANYAWPSALSTIKSGTALTTLEARADAAANQGVVVLEGTGDTINKTTGVVLGDVCTFAGDATSYRVAAIDAGINITVTPVLTITVDNGDDMTCRQLKFVEFGLTGTPTSTSANYRVTSVGGTGTSTVGMELPLPAIDVNPTDLATAGAATVTISTASEGGTAIESAATAASIATAVDEFAYAVTKFNAVIDVDTAKKTYASGADTTTKDTVTLTVTETNGVNGAKSTVPTSGSLTGVLTQATATIAISTSAESAVHTIDGDFTYLDNATAAGITAAAGDIVATGHTDALNATGSKITITDANPIATAAVAVQNGQAAVIPVQTFSGSTVVSYTSATVANTKTFTWSDLGSWTLNGASVTAYGVPMGTSVSRFLWVNNAGADSAVVSYTAVMNGSSYGPYEVATVAAKTASSIGSLIDTDMAARSIYVAPSSRANITLSAPVKAADLTVSASYKHIGDADRLAIETSDSIDGTTK